VVEGSRGLSSQNSEENTEMAMEGGANLTSSGSQEATKKRIERGEVIKLIKKNNLQGGHFQI